MGEDTGKSSGSALPISMSTDKLLAGEGLTAGDLSEFDDEGITPEDAVMQISELITSTRATLWCLCMRPGPAK